MAQTIDDLLVGIGADASPVDREFARAGQAVARFAGDIERALASIPPAEIESEAAVTAVGQLRDAVRALGAEAADLDYLATIETNAATVAQEIADVHQALAGARDAAAALVGATTAETQSLASMGTQAELAADALRKMGIAEEAIQKTLARSGLGADPAREDALRAAAQIGERVQAGIVDGVADTPQAMGAVLDEALATVSGFTAALETEAEAAGAAFETSFAQALASGQIDEATAGVLTSALTQMRATLTGHLADLKTELAFGLIDPATFATRGREAIQAFVAVVQQSVASLPRLEPPVGSPAPVHAIAAAMAQAGSGTALFAEKLRVLKADQDAAAASAEHLATANDRLRDAFRVAGAQAQELSRETRDAVTGADKMAAGIAALSPQQERVATSGQSAARSLNLMRGGLASLAVQSVGTTGALGQVAQGLLIFGGGTSLVLGVAAGLALIAFAYDRITKEAREARKATDEFIEATLRAAQQRADQRDPGRPVERAFAGGPATGDGLTVRAAKLNADIADIERRIEKAESSGNAGLIIPALEKKLAQLRAELAEIGEVAAEVGHRFLDASEAGAESRLAALAALRDAGMASAAELSEINAQVVRLRQAFGDTSDVEQRAKILGQIAALTKASATALVEAQREAARLLIDLDRQRSAIGQETAAFTNTAALDRGLIGFRQFFAERRAIVTDAVAADIAALLRERALIEQQVALTPEARVKKETDLRSNDGRIEQVQLRGRQQQRALFEEERREARALAEERLAFEGRIQDAKGQTLAAALIAINQEAAAFDRLLAKQGVEPTERTARVEDFRAAEVAKAEVAEASRQVDALYGEIARARAQIDAQVQAGLLTEVQGQARITEVIRERLPILQSLVTRMLAVARASDNPDLIRQADDLAAAFGVIAIEASDAAKAVTKLNRDLSRLGAVVDTTAQIAENLGAIDESGRVAFDTLGGLIEAGAKIASGDLFGGILQGAGALSGLFNQGPDTTAMALEENNDRLYELRVALDRSLDNVGRDLALAQAIVAVGSDPMNQNFLDLSGQTLHKSDVEEDLARFGFTMDDVERAADELNITLYDGNHLLTQGFLDVAEAMGLAIDAMGRFAETFDEQLTKEQIKDDLFGASSTDAATARMENELDALAAVAPELAQRFAGIDLDTEAGKQAFERELKRIEAEMEAGTLDPALLGGLSHDQFIQFIADGAGYVSDFNDAVQGATDSMLNVPQVFKQAGFAGDAADPVTPVTDPGTGLKETFRPIFEPGVAGPGNADVDDFLARVGQAAGSQTVTVEAGAIVVQGADQDPDTIAEAVLDRLRQRAMSVFGTTDNWGQQ